MNTAKAMPFLRLAIAEPERIGAAVAENGSAAATLRSLGYNSESSRREQLQDAVLYYGWSTAHWYAPIPEGLKPFRDFSDGSQETIESYGAAFEARVSSKIRDDLVSLGAGLHAKPGVYHYGPYSFHEESAFPTLNLGLEPSSTPPWDALLVDWDNKRVWAFEMKVGLNHMSKAGKQVQAREPWLADLRELGWATRAVCVVSNILETRRHTGAQAIRATGAWVGSLPELNTLDLIKA